jgi:hypothetical protein
MTEEKKCCGTCRFSIVLEVAFDDIRLFCDNQEILAGYVEDTSRCSLYHSNCGEKQLIQIAA